MSTSRVSAAAGYGSSLFCKEGPGVVLSFNQLSSKNKFV